MKLEISANGNSDALNLTSGTHTVQVAGTFDGATVTLQANLGNGWSDLGDEAQFTDAGVVNLQLSACTLRAVTADGGGSLDITVTVGAPIISRTL